MDGDKKRTHTEPLDQVFRDGTVGSSAYVKQLDQLPSRAGKPDSQRGCWARLLVLTRNEKMLIVF
jgi:hypothetical protein